MSEIYLSVVIPAYNEEARLGKTLHYMIRFLQDQPYASEIIIADDGSKDRTVEIAKERLAHFPHKILTVDKNRGKGNAVKRGMLSAVGRFILFSDADMSTPIDEVERFALILEKGSYDCVIGSRALPDSKLEVRQNAFRESIGKIFNRIAQALTFKGISDSQCGFKCFKREVAHDLFGRQKLDGFSFDAEILYLAQKRGYKICESPVIWRNDTQSRVQLLSDPLHMFLDLMRIRWLHRST
jgi:dolichyl-phosphate beta-glucosyltransferase